MTYRRLHPLAWWIWAGSLAIAIAKSSSVLLSLATVGATAIVVYVKAEKTPWAKSFSWSLRIGLWVILIRVLTGILIGVPGYGRTLFTLPQLPLPSWMAGVRIGGNVTLERLSSTAHDGFLMASIIALLGAAASLSSPHRLLRSMPVVVYEFGVAVVIATSVMPQLVVSANRIRQAQKLRGQSFKGLKAWRRVALPLLEDSLSRSLDLAAAMDSRGYGFSRRRSRYRPNSWRMAEYILCLLCILTFFFPVLCILTAVAPLIVVRTDFELLETAGSPP